MTISTESTRVEYTGDGATLPFAVPFKFLVKTDLVVVLRTILTGVDAVQTLYTHYTVTGAGDASGTVTFVTAPPSTQRVVIYNDPPLTQLVDYIAGGTFPAETHEEALDRLTIQQKRTREITTRAILLPDADTDGSGAYDAKSNRIKNLGAPIATTDAATKTYTDVLVNNTALGPAPTGLIATGSVTSRLLADRWGEIKNVKDYGATGDGVTNDTVAIQAAMTAGKSVFIPDGTYRVKDLVPPQFTQIICESRDTIIKGVLVTDNLVATTGSISGFRVVSGTWRDCHTVWSHTGNSAIVSSSFEGMVVKYVTTGFSFSSAVDCTWERCQIGVKEAPTSLTTGIEFKDGTGQCNTNQILNCAFGGFTARAISFDDDATVSIRNLISGCWIEKGTGTGIYVGGGTSLLSIENCYFEGVGAAGVPDIRIDATTGLIHQVSILRCRFAGGAASTDYRIRSTGGSDFTARDCHAILDTLEVFAAVDAASSFHTLLVDNYLAGVGAGTYESRLFSQTGGAKVSYSVFVGSGYVTDDTYPYSHREGGEGFVIYALPAADATPSVSGYHTVTTGSTTTITDFDDGRVGQLLTVLAEHTLIITDGTHIILNGSTNLTMAAGDSLTLVLKADNKWYETARMVNVASTAAEIPLFPVVTFAGGDATPTVLNGKYFLTAGTTAITDFDDGVVGQTITVKAKTSITITDGGDLELVGNFTMTTGDTITLTMLETGKWSEISRSDIA